MKIGRKLIAAVTLCGLCSLSVRAQELDADISQFDEVEDAFAAEALTFEDMDDPGVRRGVNDLHDESQWSLEPDDAEGLAPTNPDDPFAERVMPVDAIPERAARSGINVGAYEELLKENIDLRREITEMQQGIESAVADKRMLEDEMRALEAQVTESVAMIQSLRQQRAPVPVAAASEAGDRVMQLEADTARLETDNARLRSELATLRSQAERRAADPAPAGDSDLFRAMQQENARLKQQVETFRNEHQETAARLQQVAALQDNQNQALTAAEAREARLRDELKAARAAQDQYKRTVETLVQRVPEMEQELTRLRETLGVKDRELAERENALKTLRREMDRREDRIVKTERMAALLQQTREEVSAQNQQERRDLHYNMAAVYAKEGRYAEAEREYLNALRADPTDAHSHYNLGILYDDVLGDSSKAARHYRAYLKLAPTAGDVDEVKSWLINLEMR